MPDFGMGNETYAYDKDVMRRTVAKNVKGNYALGYTRADSFVPKCVGRSDHDLRARLIQHVDDGEEYMAFTFKYASTVKEAYETECRNFHTFQKQLNNKYHPDNPDNKKYKCAICGE